MKKKTHFALKASTITLLLGLASFANAEQLVDINSFHLVGNVESLNQADQTKLANALYQYQGKGKSMSQIKVAQEELRKVLNSLSEQQYDVVLPSQEVNNGVVTFQILAKAKQQSQIIYKASEGFDEENIKRSIPSLQAGKTYEDGRQWFDRREFNMAQTNPLKITRMHYDLDPTSKTSTLSVLGFSPYGKQRGYVSVDNYGSREFKYGRITAGYINANLTDRDDVLALNALTNFKEPSHSYAIGGTYSIPFYENHQTVGFQFGYSNLDSDQTDSLPVGMNQKMVKGKSLATGLSWSYYLPQFGIGVEDQFKINAGYSYRHFKQKHSINNFYNGAYSFSVAGINLGISGDIKFTQSSAINMDLSHYYYGKNIPGTHGIKEALGEREFDENYHITTLTLGYSQDFADGWNFNSQLSGQYSTQRLSGIDQTIITGMYGVRGYRENSLSGDKSLVWRNELSTPQYGVGKISGYVFYDMGKYKINNPDLDDNQGIISSAGVGFRTQLIKNLNSDIFVATRLHNSSKDQKANGEVMPKTTVWAKVSYSF